MKKKIEIKHCVTGEVLFELEKENNTIKDTVREAILNGTKLNGAYLAGANLRAANLSGASLRMANLRGADLYMANLSKTALSSANLGGANLHDANLSEADLREADLGRAFLYDAKLDGAKLDRANFSNADLHGVDLRGIDFGEANLHRLDLCGADLHGTDLDQLPIDFINQCSRDMLFIFKYLKSELPAFREKIIAGEINGSHYNGKCVCLIGSLAKTKGSIENVCKAIPFYTEGIHNMGETWFLSIHKGDTPDNSPFAKHALMLVDMVLNNEV